MTAPIVCICYCIACGCTEFTPCESDSGPCGWFCTAGDRGICTRCADSYRNPRAVLRAVVLLLNQQAKRRRTKKAA